MRPWFRFRSFASCSQGGLRPRALVLEHLEDRCLLSGTPSAIPVTLMPAVSSVLSAAQAQKTDVVIDWNATLLQAIWNNATATLPGGSTAKQIYSQPTWASRALAMMQVAVYDAVDAMQPTDALYDIPNFTPHPANDASPDAAAIAAAYHVASSLYGSTQQTMFDAEYSATLALVPNGQAKTDGIALGTAVANAVLAWRSNDPQEIGYTPGTGPGVYQPTPGVTHVLSPQWPKMTPFTMTSDAQFRPPGPPALNSLRYAIDFNITKALGSATSTLRTPEQTEIAHFWADVPGHSVTPPGHWNEIAEAVSLEHGLSLQENARLFAMLDLGLADAAIVSWDAKYAYNFWRPITAIQMAATDGNPLTTADPNWAPLWKTPGFPEYTSGHSTFSGAAAVILTSFFGPFDHFTIGSDDMPGTTRTFLNFQQAADEAGISRIYGGIHFMSGNLDGLASGRALGRYVLRHFLRPDQPGHKDDALAFDRGQASSTGLAATSGNAGMESVSASEPFAHLAWLPGLTGRHDSNQLAGSGPLAEASLAQSVDQVFAALADGSFDRVFASPAV